MKKNKKKYYLCIVFVMWIFQGCLVSYSLGSPATIPANAKTFTVENFSIVADLAPASLSTLYANSLITLIQNQSRLAYVVEEGDLIFEGKIIDYKVDITSVQSNNQASQNTLTVRVKVKYTNKVNENKDMDFEVSKLAYYEADKQLASEESRLNQEIVDYIAQQIFDKVFGEW